MIEGVVIKASVIIKIISALIEIAVLKSGLGAIKVISALIEARLIKGDGAVITITAETKAPIRVICKARATDINLRAFKIHIGFLCPCIAVIQTRLIDSDIIGRIKIERGPTTIRIGVSGC